MTAMTSHLQCILLHLRDGTEGIESSHLSDYLAKVSQATDCPLFHLSSRWIDGQTLATLMADIKASAAKPSRTTLLICGSYLEDQLTVCALEALLEGFDVHLLCDVISARDQKLKPVALLRLFQAGAVPSSLRQFIYMWHAGVVDERMNEKLRGLLTEYDLKFEERPA